MIPEIGFFAIILALLLAAVQAGCGFWGAYRNDQTLMQAVGSAALGQFLLILIAFCALVYSFLVSDFSVTTVADNSNTAKPLLYKFAGTWGNHEGSMLLWVLILAGFGWCVAHFGATLPPTLKARVLAVQASIGAAFLAFIVFTSNPFARLAVPPANGADLNPLLQDPGLAFHPPFLYLGYVGFSMAFSFSVAALIEGRVDAAWARWVRPWVLASWCFLTIGIAMGSWWAYYELGWGGWWFWDPVENASFMPWLAGTALLHSALVVERRQSLVNWTLLLGIVTFSLSLIGTFLVRSGVLTSVHAFALDPARGVFILAILLVTTCAAFIIYAWRAPSLEAGPTFAPVSREGALVLNNIFLVCGAATVFLGTFYPLIIDAIGTDKISVGPPYFERTFVPIMVPMLIAMAVGPVLKWRKDDLLAALPRLKYAIAAALVIMGALTFLTGSLGAGFGIGLAVWLMAGTLVMFARRLRLGAVPLAKSLRLAAALPGSDYGLFISHGAMGVCVAGMVAMSNFASEDMRALAPGESFTFAGYDITFQSISRLPGPNYDAETGHFRIARNGREIAVLSPERRFYPVRQMETTEASIRTRPMSNLYLAMGAESGGKWSLRTYHHPLAVWIWLGALGMAGGGFISLTDRRFRLGTRAAAGARARAALPVGEAG